MTTAMDITQTIQDGVLKAVETTQRWTVGAVKTSTAAFDGMAPDFGFLPMADRLPTPQAAIDQTFAFAERLLEAQRQFLIELAATAPAPAAATPAKKAS